MLGWTPVASDLVGLACLCLMWTIHRCSFTGAAQPSRPLAATHKSERPYLLSICSSLRIFVLRVGMGGGSARWRGAPWLRPFVVRSREGGRIPDPHYRSDEPPRMAADPYSNLSTASSR